MKPLYGQNTLHVLTYNLTMGAISWLPTLPLREKEFNKNSHQVGLHVLDGKPGVLEAGQVGPIAAQRLNHASDQM